MDPPDDDEDKKKEPKNGKLLHFPGSKGLGMDYILGGVNTVPTADVMDPAEIEREVREREQYVKGQELVLRAEPGASPTDLIDILIREMAEEAAHLKFERRKAASEGKNTAPYTASRINGLRSLGELLLKKKAALSEETLDLKSPRVQKLLNVFMDMFYNSMEKSGMSAESIDVVFQTVKAELPEWEKRMEAV